MADFGEEVFTRQREAWDQTQLMLAKMKGYIERRGPAEERPALMQTCEIYLTDVKHNIEGVMRAEGHEIPEQVHEVLPAFAPEHDNMDELREKRGGELGPDGCSCDFIAVFFYCNDFNLIWFDLCCNHCVSATNKFKQI
jgi:hypothetical protein